MDIQVLELLRVNVIPQLSNGRPQMNHFDSSLLTSEL